MELSAEQWEIVKQETALLATRPSPEEWEQYMSNLEAKGIRTYPMGVSDVEELENDGFLTVTFHYDYKEE
jgi:hypothetical protein